MVDSLDIKDYLGIDLEAGFIKEKGGGGGNGTTREEEGGRRRRSKGGGKGGEEEEGELGKRGGGEQGGGGGGGGGKRSILEKIELRMSSLYKKILIPLKGGFFLAEEGRRKGEGKLRNGGFKNNIKRLMKRSSLMVCKILFFCLIF